MVTKYKSLARQKRVRYLAYAVLLLFAIAVTFITLKTWQTKPAQPVADNPVVRQYREKLPVLKASVQKSPKDFNARITYAQALYATGDKEAAKREYEAAIKLNAKDASTYNNLGNAYRDLNAYEAAATAYEKSFTLDPTFTNAYINLATMQAYTLKKPSDAVATYKLAIAKIGQTPDLLLLLGGAYEQNNQQSLALSAYRTALSKDPDNAAAKQNVERLEK